MNIVLYSTGCPKCKILKQKLDKKGIPYTENNSVQEMLKLGLVQAPALSVDGELLLFDAALAFVQNK